MNWEHFKAILWLRWRLSRNQWAKSGGLGAVLAAIIALLALVAGGVAFLVGLLAGGFALEGTSATVVSLVWAGVGFGFVFSWTIGVLTELQRSESIDIQRFLHLPVSLRQVFLINYVVSHYSFSIVLMVPLMVGLSLGLAISRGPRMLLLLPVATSVVFSITAWTYALRGWIAAAMSNPRRRRSIIVGLTIVFVAVAQGPNLYFNLFRSRDVTMRRPDPSAPEYADYLRRREQQQDRTIASIKAIEKFVPPLWTAAVTEPLLEGRPLPALAALGGLLLLGILGIERAYAGTLRFYRGNLGGAATASPLAPAGRRTPAPGERNLLEWRLPKLSEEGSAVALAALRTMLRAPELKLIWGLAILIPGLIGPGALLPLDKPLPENARPLVATATVAFAIFMLVQMFGNQFGFDRDGFRTLVLSPVSRRTLLLGKNVATLTTSFCVELVPLTVVSVILKLPALDILAALFQLAILSFVAVIAGNLSSILFAYRFAPGSLKPTKMPAASTLALVAVQMLFPMLTSPAFIPPAAQWAWRALGYEAAVPVNLILSSVFAAVAAALYRVTLEPMSRLLRARETMIIGRVTADVE